MIKPPDDFFDNDQITKSDQQGTKGAPQTITLPASTNTPTFYGKPSERPGQFLIRIEDYSETINQWNRNDLVRGISQFLRDSALDWYCRLRRTERLPNSWNEFKRIFLDQFNSPLRTAQRQRDWDECKQKKMK
jgi:hypothetical protein